MFFKSACSLLVLNLRLSCIAYTGGEMKFPQKYGFYVKTWWFEILKKINGKKHASPKMLCLIVIFNLQTLAYFDIRDIGNWSLLLS